MAALALLGFVGSACTDGVQPTGDAYVRVMIGATGGDIDQDGYDILVDALPKVVVGNHAGERTFTLSSGTHVIAIDKVAENCHVNGPNPRTVTVAPGETVTVQFDVTCAPTGVLVTTRTAGSDVREGFYVVVDELAAVFVKSNGSVAISRLTAGKHTVIVLVPPNCSVSPSATTVTVAVARLTELPFDIACTPVERLEKIAYVDGTPVDQTPPTQRIVLVNLDGTGVTKLQPGDSPAWSPDGKRLAFSNTVCYPSYYYDYPPSCTGGLIVLDPELGDASEPKWGLSVETPSWSPTDDAIAVAVPRSTGGTDIAVVMLAAPEVKPLSIDGPALKSQPAWSPDGKRIAFACYWLQGVTDICIANRDGSGLVRLTMDYAVDVHPAWSPDGTTIAFAKYPVGTMKLEDADLVLMDLASRQTRILTKGGDPAWSPDGSKLVFAGGDGLFIIDADGTNRRRLTTGPHYEPAWRP